MPILCSSRLSFVSWSVEVDSTSCNVGLTSVSPNTLQSDAWMILFARTSAKALDTFVFEIFGSVRDVCLG